MNVVCYKHDVPDPIFYNSIISKHKKKKNKESNNAEYWYEMGRLYEARIDMINSFAKRNFIIQNFYIVVLLGIFCIIFTMLNFDWNQIALNTKIPSLIITIKISLTFCLFLNIYIWFTRYPPSGARYFRKAIKLNPNCADAYGHLGLIELRRRNKQIAYAYLEKAIKLNSSYSNRIENKLRSIYEREFVSFFNKFSEQNNDREEILKDQKKQIKQLNGKITYLENLISDQNEKLDQAKWKNGYEKKIMGKELDAHVSEIQQIYENRIESVKRDAETEAIQIANQKFTDLTMEILEEKAKLEAGSYKKSEKSVETMLGKTIWSSLAKQTMKFLATSEQVYSVLSSQEDNPDYSLVGMELCKAFETEMNRKLVKPFNTFIKGRAHDFLRINQTGEINGKPTYFNHLAKLIDKHYYKEIKALTIGQYHFVLKLALKGDYALRYYSDFINSYHKTSSKLINNSFLKRLETLTFKYRNAIAHQKPMGKDEFEKLRFIVLSSENSLMRILAKF